jgi:hypothetical protein
MPMSFFVRSLNSLVKADVDAVLAQSRADRGRGSCFACRNLQLHIIR